MPGPVAYEPSFGAIVAHVLPPGTTIVSGQESMRRRVTWPVMARSTGIGEIEGGELVLVPAGRVREVLSRLRDLESIGIVAVVAAAEAGIARELEAERTGIPVAQVPPEVDLRQLQTDIERYVARRRRELFAFDQQSHHRLIDAAIAGQPIAAVIASAADASGKLVVIDRDGEPLYAPEAGPPPLDALLVRARIAAREAAGVMEISEPEAALAAAIVTGKERRGTALIVGGKSGISDEDEVLLAALVSAIAIVLSREPVARLPTIPEAIDALPDVGSATSEWHVVAFEDSSASLRQLERLVTSELRNRDATFTTAVDGSRVLAFVDARTNLPWEALVAAIGSRLGSEQLRAGLGRKRRGQAGAEHSSRDAIEALARSEPNRLTTYESIELSALLESGSAWSEFAASRLGPLLGIRQEDSDLLETLAVYLSSGRNAKAAAQRLQVHRNTLMYRLRRIEERLDVQLDDPDTLFSLELATRVAALDRERVIAAAGTS